MILIKVEFEMEVLSEKRETLTKILLELIEKKKDRAGDIQVTYSIQFQVYQ